MTEWVKICKTESAEPVEIETEEDGTISLESVAAHFPGTTTMKYKNPSGTGYRSVKLREGVISAPKGGWDASPLYIAVNPAAEKQAEKRKTEVDARACVSAKHVIRPKQLKSQGNNYNSCGGDMGGRPPGRHGKGPGMWGPQVGWGVPNSNTGNTEHWAMYNKMMQGMAPYVAPWGPPLPSGPAPPSGYKSYNKSSSTQECYTLGDQSGELKYGGHKLGGFAVLPTRLPHYGMGLGLGGADGRLSINGVPGYFPTVREKVVQEVPQVKKEMKDGTSVPALVASVPGGDYRGGHVARKREYKEEYYGETCESKKLNMEVILKHEIPNIKKEIYP